MNDNKITLRFITRNDISSFVIRYFSAGDYSHVDYSLGDGTYIGSHINTIGGIPSGVQIRPNNYIAPTKELFVTIPCTSDEAASFDSFIKSQLGKPYDVSAIFGFAFDRDWRKPDSWFCSELISAGLEHCGVFPFPLVLASNKITHVGLLLVLSAIVRI